MIRLWKYLLDLLYPWKCPGCRISREEHALWCDSCLRKIWNPRMLNGSRSSNLDGCYALCNYEGPIRKCIVSLKFSGKKHLARSFPELLNRFPWWKALKNFRTAIPIPLSHKRLRERGYNQTDLIFESWMKAHGRSYLPQGLVRVRHTAAQSGLMRHERLLNMRNAFHINRGIRIRGENIILCDDVYTTGATMEAAAAELKRAGAAMVMGITIASGRR